MTTLYRVQVVNQWWTILTINSKVLKNLIDELLWYKRILFS